MRENPYICGGCFYFRDRQVGGTGKCHFYPPHPRYGLSVTKINSWCGQYKSQRVEDNKEKWAESLLEQDKQNNPRHYAMLHDENKLDLDGGCFIDGVFHRVKKNDP